MQINDIVLIFFNKTYLQKPHCVAIENMSSNAAVKIFL